MSQIDLQLLNKHLRGNFHGSLDKSDGRLMLRPKGNTELNPERPDKFLTTKMEHCCLLVYNFINNSKHSTTMNLTNVILFTYLQV